MYIITDMTEFRKEKVCIAMIDSETGTCIRPLPYLTLDDCRARDLLPGKVVAVDRLSTKPDLEPPHIEDRIGSFTPQRYATKDEFKSALKHGCFEDGFGIPTQVKQLPFPNQAVRSLITYIPQSLFLVDTPYGIKAHADHWRYLPVKDLRFCHPTAPMDLNTVNSDIRMALNRRELFLRLGFTRPLKSGEGQKCYLQVTGIYPFLEGPGVP